MCQNPLYTMKAMEASDTPSTAPSLSTQWVDDNATQEPIREHLALSLVC